MGFAAELMLMAGIKKPSCRNLVSQQEMGAAEEVGEAGTGGHIEMTVESG